MFSPLDLLLQGGAPAGDRAEGEQGTLLAVHSVVGVDGKEGRGPIGPAQRIRRKLAENHVGVLGLGQHAVAEHGGAAGDQGHLARHAVVNVGRAHARQQRLHAGRLEERRDVLGLLHADFEGQEAAGLCLVKPEGHEVAAGLEEVGDGRSVGGQLLSSTGAHDENLVGRQSAALIGPRGDAGEIEVVLAGRIADIQGLATGGRFPAANILHEVSGDRFRRRIAFAPAGHVELAEQHEPLAFAILHQRAVLQGVAAVDDGQEVAPRRLLDQHRGHVTAIAATPHAGYLDVAPLDAPARRKNARVACSSTAAG